jgi:hypothetical protein
MTSADKRPELEQELNKRLQAAYGAFNRDEIAHEQLDARLGDIWAWHSAEQSKTDSPPSRPAPADAAQTSTAVGRALYGDELVGPLASRLGVERNTVGK